jgi:topoisomerase-4 subunit B
MGNGKKVESTLKDKTVSVRDWGRGIPLGKVVECVSQINTGAEYSDDVFQFSVGLNGVGTKKADDAETQFFKLFAYNSKSITMVTCLLNT